MKQLVRMGALVALMIAYAAEVQGASNANDLMASGIPPQDARESAILIRLEPGFYTAVIRGANDATGISLIEVYEIDRD